MLNHKLLEPLGSDAPSLTTPELAGTPNASPTGEPGGRVLQRAWGRLVSLGRRGRSLASLPKHTVEDPAQIDDTVAAVSPLYRDEPICELPPDEEVRLRSIWVAEAYPPSCVPALLDAVARLGWNLPDRYGRYALSADVLREARTGRSHGFVNLGTMARAGRYNDLLGYRTLDLPAGITQVDVSAHHPVPSVTILVFRFILSHKASGELTGVFQREDPALREDFSAWIQREGPRVSDMRASTRSVRERRRSACVEWVAARVPGLFARWRESVTAEFITLEVAEPLVSSGPYDEPYLQALSLGSCYSAFELWGRQGLRMTSPWSYLTDGNLLFCGQTEKLCEMEDPDEPGSMPSRVAREVHEPMVQWALHEAMRRSAERVTGLRDAVAEVAAAESPAGINRLGEVQREFMRMVVDTVPMEREVRELCADQKRYHREGSEFKPIEMYPRAATSGEHALEQMRQRTSAEADLLSRATADLREMITTTSAILNSLAQQRVTDDNLKLQQRVYWMTIVFGILAAVLSLLQILG